MDTTRNLRLEIEVSGKTPHELCDELSDYFSDRKVHGMIKLMAPRERFRSIDTSVLVAVITASATALGALITGLLAVVKQRQAQRLLVRGRRGESIEFPLGISDKQIKGLLDILEEMDQPKVYICKD